MHNTNYIYRLQTTGVYQGRRLEVFGWSTKNTRCFSSLFERREIRIHIYNLGLGILQSSLLAARCIVRLIVQYILVTMLNSFLYTDNLYRAYFNNCNLGVN
jgi:hypothetical protein